MKRISTLVLAILLTNSINAQCDASFGFTVNDNQVHFYNMDSITVRHHTWHFGDGATFNQYGASSYINHQYNSGTYLVTHIVYDSLQNCRDTVMKTVTINFTATCNAAFYAVPDSSFSNRVSFISNSTNTGGFISSYSWSVNGTPLISYNYYSNSIDTTFSTGQYQVCLSITTSAGCTSSFCETINIVQPSACVMQSSFTATVSPSNSGNISFVPIPASASYKYEWNFGDGTLSHQVSPIHNYYNSGIYTVRLLVSDTINSCVDTVLKQLSVIVPAPDTCSVTFNYSTGTNGVTQFTAASAASIASYQWQIDSTITSASNPSHNFTDSGYHFVCLVVTTNSGCVAQYCDTIFISSGVSGRIAADIPSYPNPVSGSFVHLKLYMEENGKIIYRVFNRFGNTVIIQQLNGIKGNNILKLPIQQLESGQYFVEIFGNGESKKSVFIKL